MNIILYMMDELIEWKEELKEVTVLKYFIIAENKEDYKFLEEIKLETDLNIQEQFGSLGKLY